MSMLFSELGFDLQEYRNQIGHIKELCKKDLIKWLDKKTNVLRMAIGQRFLNPFELCLHGNVNEQFLSYNSGV